MDSNSKGDKGNIEVVQDYNIRVLEDIELYLQYIRETIKQIIVDDGLKYSEPMDKKKIYPDFTYTQFLYLLSRVFDRVYSVNTALLYDSYNNKYSKVYNTRKVELCYEVYHRLCGYYGFICSIEGFYKFVGIDRETLLEWLSSGKSELYKKAIENSKNTVLSGFENSQVPILRLAAGNYKYKLNTPIQERQEAVAVDVLPDLLAISGTKENALTDSKN